MSARDGTAAVAKSGRVLTEVLVEVNQISAEPIGYNRLYRAVLAGRVPARRVGRQWHIAATPAEVLAALRPLTS